MKIFITGATGFIGSAVAEALARRGHAVLGLARDPEKARALAVREITPVMGDISRPGSYAEAAKSAQIFIHCAAEMSARFADLDRRTAESLLGLAAQSGRPSAVIYTSGVWLYGDTGGLADETAADSAGLNAWRRDVERTVLGASGPSLRGLVVRPGCVYGGRGSLTALWFSGALKDGAAPIIGDGANRWAMVHVEDLADLYARLAESSFSNELFNAADSSRLTVSEMARAASRAAGAQGKIKTLLVEQAEKQYGPVLAKGMALDQQVDSGKAARLLGWTPRFGGFTDGADRFFAAWKASQGR